MEISDIYVGLGQEAFGQLLKAVSLGKLRTYQLFDRMKFRLHLAKLNAETLRKSQPKLWTRLVEKDQELGTDLAQAILISHLDTIIDVLNFLGIPHEDGFFAKETDVTSFLTADWQQRSYAEFKEKHNSHVLAFYLNHLAFEMTKDAQLFLPA